jgi:hypothetical protein
MDIFAGWRIDLVDATTTTNLTSYAQGFQISCNINIGRFTQTQIVLTLDNDSGDFTPAEGGGSGTFANTDWLSKAIQITPSNDSTAIVAHGFVSNIDIQDNGTNSTVNMTCRDWVTLSSSDPFSVSGSTLQFNYVDGVNTALGPFGAALLGNNGQLPKYGQPTWDIVPDFVDYSETSTTSYPAVLQVADATNVTTLDLLNQVMFGGYPSVFVPTHVVGNSGDIEYKGFAVCRHLTRSSTYRQTFSFSENATGTTLAFDRVIAGFNHDELTNKATIESGISGVTSQSSTNTDTGYSYGSRTRTYTGTGNIEETDTATDAGALEAAEFWTKRQGTTRYSPQQLTTSIELLETTNGAAAATTLKNLLGASTGLFQPCNVTYTPTGGSQVTANCVITGRTIQAVPGRTTITLNLLPAEDYQSFVLDSDTLGVLDTNRLG